MSTIAIFDSGVGGLSIFQEIQKICGEHHYLFISDNQGFPYGSKDDGELLRRVQSVVTAIDQAFAPDLLVVACNTASTVALPSLREAFNFPIVGVVPAVKPAAGITESKVIGLLATPATIRREYTHQLVDEFADDCEIISVGSKELVEMAESKMAGDAVDLTELAQILAPFLKRSELDVLVLACTHFPLLNKEISLIFQKNSQSVMLLDSGKAIAKRVQSLLPERRADRAAPALAVFTKEPGDSGLISALRSYGFNQYQVLSI